MPRGAGVLAAASLILTLAGRVSAETGLLPIAVATSDPQRAAELRTALEIEVADALKRKLIKVVPAKTCVEDFGAKCALDLASAPGPTLDEVAQVTVRDQASGFVVDIAVRETGEGKRVFHETVTQAPSDGPGVVAAALRRAFDPRSWSGRIVVTGAPDDAEVLIDGLRAIGPTVVRAGPHDVVVRTADGFDRTYDVQVAAGEITTIAAGAAAPAARAPMLPALALGGLGTVAAGASAAFVGILIATELDTAPVEGSDGQLKRIPRDVYLPREARNGSAKITLDPSGNSWERGYGSTAGDELTDTAHFAQRAAAHGELLADRALRTIDTVAAIVTASVAVAALVGAMVVWPVEPDERGEREPASAPTVP